MPLRRCTESVFDHTTIREQTNADEEGREQVQGNVHAQPRR